MVNSSLAYEILLYLNSFYFGMFACCELGMGVLKGEWRSSQKINTKNKAINDCVQIQTGINLKYTQSQIQSDAWILVAILTVETIRVLLGRKGSLSEHGKYT